MQYRRARTISRRCVTGRATVFRMDTTQGRTLLVEFVKFVGENIEESKKEGTRQGRTITQKSKIKTQDDYVLVFSWDILTRIQLGGPSVVVHLPGDLCDAEAIAEIHREARIVNLVCGGLCASSGRLLCVPRLLFRGLGSWMRGNS